MTSFWLANTSRLLHCLKQYSGDEVIFLFFFLFIFLSVCVRLAAYAKTTGNLNAFIP